MATITEIPTLPPHQSVAQYQEQLQANTKLIELLREEVKSAYGQRNWAIEQLGECLPIVKRYKDFFPATAMESQQCDRILAAHYTGAHADLMDMAARFDVIPGWVRILSFRGDTQRDWYLFLDCRLAKEIGNELYGQLHGMEFSTPHEAYEKFLEHPEIVEAVKVCSRNGTRADNSSQVVLDTHLG